MKAKYLFFDIDGTLVNFQAQMPESAKRALSLAQARGHRIFLCTGRGKSQIYPFLLDFGFDGIVAGAGTYVEWDGEVLYHRTFGRDNIQKIVEFFERQGIAYMLQGAGGCVLTKKGMIRFIQSMGYEAGEDQIEETKKILENSLGKVILDDDTDHFPEKYDITENILYANSPLSLPDVQEKLGPTLTVTAPSFGRPRPDQGEISITGIKKSIGMQQIMNAAGIEREDTIAFGDAANDLNMLLFAGCGVAMGNAVPEVKEAADYITSDIDDDGIYRAMRELDILA